MSIGSLPFNLAGGEVHLVGQVEDPTKDISAWLVHGSRVESDGVGRGVALAEEVLIKVEGLDKVVPSRQGLSLGPESLQEFWRMLRCMIRDGKQVANRLDQLEACSRVTNSSRTRTIQEADVGAAFWV